VRAIYGDSATVVDAARGHGPYDLLYIDALHDFNHAYGEYVLYREFVVDGGMIFFDDLDLDMATGDMQILWDHVVDPKSKLPGLHVTGFGVAVKDPAVRPRPWQEVIDAVEMQRSTWTRK
jgi:predicted O-methyltransferase YrrM